MNTSSLTGNLGLGSGLSTEVGSSTYGVGNIISPAGRSLMVEIDMLKQAGLPPDQIQKRIQDAATSAIAGKGKYSLSELMLMNMQLERDKKAALLTPPDAGSVGDHLKQGIATIEKPISGHPAMAAGPINNQPTMNGGPMGAGSPLPVGPINQQSVMGAGPIGPQSPLEKGPLARARHGGLADISVHNIGKEENYAGGGIVAFAGDSPAGSVVHSTGTAVPNDWEVAGGEALPEGLSESTTLAEAAATNPKFSQLLSKLGPSWADRPVGEAIKALVKPGAGLVGNIVRGSLGALKTGTLPALATMGGIDVGKGIYGGVKGLITEKGSIGDRLADLGEGGVSSADIDKFYGWNTADTALGDTGHRIVGVLNRYGTLGIGGPGGMLGGTSIFNRDNTPTTNAGSNNSGGGGGGSPAPTGYQLSPEDIAAVNKTIRPLGGLGSIDVPQADTTELRAHLAEDRARANAPILTPTERYTQEKAAAGPDPNDKTLSDIAKQQAGLPALQERKEHINLVNSFIDMARSGAQTGVAGNTVQRMLMGATEGASNYFKTKPAIEDSIAAMNQKLILDENLVARAKAEGDRSLRLEGAREYNTDVRARDQLLTANTKMEGEIAKLEQDPRLAMAQIKATAGLEAARLKSQDPSNLLPQYSAYSTAALNETDPAKKAALQQRADSILTILKSADPRFAAVDQRAMSARERIYHDVLAANPRLGYLDPADPNTEKQINAAIKTYLTITGQSPGATSSAPKYNPATGKIE